MPAMDLDAFIRILVSGKYCSKYRNIFLNDQATLFLEKQNLSIQMPTQHFQHTDFNNEGISVKCNFIRKNLR
jgi:hypothetical protein